MTGQNADKLKFIRTAKPTDLSRIAEIIIFNYRLNFYPIFLNDWFYFEHLQAANVMLEYQQNEALLANTFVYDDGVVKGLIQLDGCEVKKLFVEPVLQRQGIGGKLLDFAIAQKDIRFLWALEKNTKAIAFYQRHGFHLTNEKKAGRRHNRISGAYGTPKVMKRPALPCPKNICQRSSMAEPF